MDYLPPLVQANNFKEFADVRETLKETGLNVGGYIRISTKKDSQLTSVENQKKYIAEWAGINKYTISDFYIDVRTGAYSYLRNEMSRLKDDISQGRIKGVVCKEISRTSRDIMDIIELKRSLAAQGAFFISIKEGYDSRTDDDEFLLVIHAGLAQKERKTTSSRVKITQMIKANEGKTNVSKPALGYKLSEDSQYLVVNKETSEVYKLIVNKYLEGWGSMKICRLLNSMKVKTSRGGDNWTTNGVMNILTNPVYLGISMYNVTLTVRDGSGKAKRMVRPREQWIVRENTHPALITVEKFERIQQIVQVRREKEKKEWSCTRKYLLSGLLYCASCGSKLFGGKIPKNQARSKLKTERTAQDYYFYYFDRKTDGMCENRISHFKMELVDKMVIQAIQGIFMQNNVMDEIVRRKRYIYDLSLEKEKRECEVLKDRLENINSAIKKQQLAFEAEAITLEEYGNRMGELRSQRAEMNSRLHQLEQKLLREGDTEERYIEIREKVKSLIQNIDALDYEFKEELVRKIIKKVTIYDDYRIKLQYTFDE